MGEFHCLEQFVFALKFLDNILVCVLAEQAFEVVYGVFESASVVNHLNKRQTVLFADFAVILAKCGRDMHDARAVGERDVRIVGDIVRLFLCARVVIEKRFVFYEFVFATLFRVDFDVLVFIFEQGRNQSVCEDIKLLSDLNLRIVLFAVHTKSDVRRKRPRRSRPSEEIRVFNAFNFKFDENGSFLNVLVALRHFVRGKSRSATRTIRHDFVAFIDKSLVSHLLDSPPYRLDIVVVVSDVGILHIRPIPDTIGHFLPLVGVFPNGFLTFFDKRLDAVLFDFLLTVDAELFFDFQFHGQTVSIPTRFAQNVITLHRLVARDNILHNASENVSDMRFTVRSGRTVIKTEFGITFVLFYALFKNVLLFPKSENLLFAINEIQICFNRFVHIVL